MSKKVLIIGGCGFIGRNLALKLFEDGFDVTLFDKNISLSNVDEDIKNKMENNVKIVSGDFLDFDNLIKIVKENNIVFHFGAIKGIADSNINPIKTTEINILGTVNILEACRKCNVERFIFASSLYAISNYWGSFYATSKMACELLIERYNMEFGLNYTILRYDSVYGRDAGDINRITQMICDAISKKEISYSLNVSRDFMHIQDATNLVANILKDNKFLNKKVNIKGNQRIDTFTLATIIRETLPLDVKLVATNETEGHYNQTVCKCIDNEVVCTASFDSFISMEDGINDCVNYYYKKMSQIKIHKNILALKNEFDVFLFDAYGVFYDGTNFYKGAVETMEQLVLSGKTIVIISNTSRTSDESEKEYKDKGLIKNKHYNFIVTAGEVLNDYFTNDKIIKIADIKKKNKKVKVYIYSISERGVIKNFLNEFEETKTPEGSDFIYITPPRITNEDYLDYIKKYPEHKKYFSPDKKHENGNIKRWEAIEITPFIQEIKDLSEIILKNNLLVISPNTDIFTNSKNVINNANVVGVRHGSVIKELRKNGVTEIIEFGKPNENIYKFTFDILKKHNINVKNEKIAMVGDVLRTDIKGANNIGISSILCCKTGITADQIYKGYSLRELIKNENVVVDYFIESVSGENSHT